MVINIQSNETADLLFEMLAALPEDRRHGFSQRVTRIAPYWQHPPSLDADVLVTLRSHDDGESACAPTCIVLPLHGPQVAQSV